MAHAGMVAFIWIGICVGSALIALLLWVGLRIIGRYSGQNQTAVGVLITLLLLTLIGIIIWGFVRWR
ncbi:MAG: hypothetical protein H6665_05545 [Ardenticatenaceae bacterium]|nr:hypothetical protein [Ardenticatenaceae bacterium]